MSALAASLSANQAAREAEKPTLASRPSPKRSPTRARFYTRACRHPTEKGDVTPSRDGRRRARSIADCASPPRYQQLRRIMSRPKRNRRRYARSPRWRGTQQERQRVVRHSESGTAGAPEPRFTRLERSSSTEIETDGRSAILSATASSVSLPSVWRPGDTQLSDFERHKPSGMH